MSESAEQDPSVLMKAARLAVARLEKAVARYRRFMILLSVVCLGLVVGGVILGITVSDVNGDNHASCVSGNTFRANDQLRWDDFINLLIKGSAHPDPKSLAEAHAYLALVAKTDELRSC